MDNGTARTSNLDILTSLAVFVVISVLIGVIAHKLIDQSRRLQCGTNEIFDEKYVDDKGNKGGCRLSCLTADGTQLDFDYDSGTCICSEPNYKYDTTSNTCKCNYKLCGTDCIDTITTSGECVDKKWCDDDHYYEDSDGKGMCCGRKLQGTNNVCCPDDKPRYDPITKKCTSCNSDSMCGTDCITDPNSQFCCENNVMLDIPTELQDVAKDQLKCYNNAGTGNTFLCTDDKVTKYDDGSFGDCCYTSQPVGGTCCAATSQIDEDGNVVNNCVTEGSCKKLCADPTKTTCDNAKLEQFCDYDNEKCLIVENKAGVSSYQCVNDVCHQATEKNTYDGIEMIPQNQFAEKDTDKKGLILCQNNKSSDGKPRYVYASTPLASQSERYEHIKLGTDCNKGNCVNIMSVLEGAPTVTYNTDTQECRADYKCENILPSEKDIKTTVANIKQKFQLEESQFCKDQQANYTGQICTGEDNVCDPAAPGEFTTCSQGYVIRDANDNNAIVFDSRSNPSTNAELQCVQAMKGSNLEAQDGEKQFSTEDECKNFLSELGCTTQV